MKNGGINLFFSKRKERLFFISIATFACLIINAQSTPYPTIDHFSANRAGDNVILNWTISPGMACATIYVMHSIDSINFTPVFEYPGICGPNAVSESNSFTHEFPSTTKNYYRMDIGSEEGRTIIPVYMILFGNDGFTIAANQYGQSSIHFYNPGNVRYTFDVYSLDGKVCYHEEKINSNTIALPDIYNHGILIFRLIGEDGTIYIGKYLNPG